MAEIEVSAKRQPVLTIIAGAVLALSLFTPMLLVTLPIMVAVGLSIGAAFRKEEPVWLPYVVGAAAVVFLVITHSHSLTGLREPQVVHASDIYANAKWEYGESKDEMRGTVSKSATLYSPTDLDLPAPYDGTNSAQIYVSELDGIMLTIEKGQFQCNSNDSVAIKIDSGPVWSYPCSMSDNGETKYLFVNSKYSPDTGQPVDPKDLLTKGKKMTVEASFFDAGTRQIVFNIAGFDPSKLK